VANAIDVAASSVALIALGLVLSIYFGSAALFGRRSFARIEKEGDSPFLGKAPMEAGYQAIIPVASALIGLGISANAVTLASLGLAAIAAVLFAFGHFGLGAVIAIIATMADAVDGLIARETKTESQFGQVLDTTVDRYVDALLLGGIAVFVRQDVALLAIVLAALVGGFMVSYASSVLRELRVSGHRGAMRRAERVVYVLGGALLVPVVATATPDSGRYVHLSPLMFALGVIAVVANGSAVMRLLAAAKAVSAADVSGAQPTARAAIAAPVGPAVGQVVGAPVSPVMGSPVLGAQVIAARPSRPTLASPHVNARRVEAAANDVDLVHSQPARGSASHR
jgi:phosphatidylglycerophosphate synthase